MKTRFLQFGKKLTASIAVSLVFSVLATALVLAGTTGKISGRVTDAQTHEPLVGATIQIEGTYMGAASDMDGYYYINNIPPGNYTVFVNMLGYQKAVVKNAGVRIDLTTKLDVKLSQQVLDVGKEVVIQAERPLVQKDLTSTSVTVSSEEIKFMPVENINQVINLQAGVVGGHFRGGRSGEVAYLIDGVSVNDPRSGGVGITPENSSVREMEVISGTFNAEYGQAMSGVVNIVTQDGSDKFAGSLGAYFGDYFTTHTDVFQNLDKLNITRTRNLQFSLSGPTMLVPHLTFFATGRLLKEEGHLYGKRVYNVGDDVPVRPFADRPDFWIARNTGDGEYVAMDPQRRYSGNAKLTYSQSAFKVSYGVFAEDWWGKNYNHAYAWTPDGTMNHYSNNMVHSFQINHVPSPSTYQSLRFSANIFTSKGYLYENPFDPRYVSPDRGTPPSNYTFRSGGNETGRYDNKTQSLIGQWTLSSQVSKEHKVSVGVEGRQHDLYTHGTSIRNMTENLYDSLGNNIFTIGYPQLGTLGNQEYRKKPVEASAYVQDKMEYGIMIINAGIRVDYFDPRSELLFDKRNPMRNSDYPNAGVMKKADTKIQVSPRLGISFPITDQGIIHFSYGHFFQIPNFDNLYTNSDYLIDQSTTLSSTMGNPDLEAQRTVMYELGVQQELFSNIGVDFTVYYRDIRNLLGMEIVNSYEGFKYGRYINRDYGNVRGFIISLDRRFANFFSARVDYTYQIAEGNASDPMSNYNNNQSNPPIETNKKTLPLNWDQRSTLNLSLTVGDPGNWTAGLIFQYGSGFPYTEDTRVSQGVRFENGGVKPMTNSLDLRLEKSLRLAGLDINLFALVYNLLDTKNEYGVNAASGRANVDPYTYEAGEIIGLNTIQQYLNNPTSFSAPRQVRLGFNLGF
ncbi:MAG: TonB-dependent receptor [Acidobacteriota bacterium]